MSLLYSIGGGSGRSLAPLSSLVLDSLAGPCAPRL